MAVYKGNDKNNTYFGTSGDDQAYGLGGTDVFYGNAGNDTLNGDSGNDFLEGGIGNDILNGGAGNDSLSDSVGDDTYLIAKTDGFDTLNDLTGTDTVKFSNVASTDITQIARIGGEGNSLLLAYGSANQLTVQNYFSFAANRIEQFQFNDGVTWTWADIKTKALKSGANGNDILYGYDDENDTLNGLAGNDILKGYGGNDTLNGGGGNDELFGGDGNDTYLVAEADGYDFDTIYESSGNNIVQFINIASSDIDKVSRYFVSFPYVPEDSLHLYYGNGNRLEVSNYFVFSGDRIGQFRFSDGVVWGWEDIKTKALHPGTNGDDALNGYDDEDDTLNGLGGNDWLYGGDGNDKLNGGRGDDTMFGGDGADQYWVDSTGDKVYELGSLSDIDTVYSSVDFALFGKALSVENLTLLAGANNAKGNGQNNILIGNKAANSLVGFDGNDSLTGGNDEGDGDILDGGNGVDMAHYWTATQGVAINLNITESQDTQGAGYDTLISIENLNGSAFDDTLIGNGASNALYGGKGNDTLQGNGGNDSLLGDVGNDVLDGGDGVDYAQYWNATARVVVNLGLTLAQDTQGAGLDTLTNIENVNGSGFNDILVGNTSSNWLLGGAGNDTLNGGLGNDFLKGGAGQDAFVFNTALGSISNNKDVLTDFSVADDSIQLENSIFTALTATGTLANTAFKIIGNGNTVDGDDHLLYNTATGGIFYDTDGNGAAASVLVAIVGKSLAMTAADFLVI